jgi:hypothetical protein
VCIRPTPPPVVDRDITSVNPLGTTLVIDVPVPFDAVSASTHNVPFAVKEVMSIVDVVLVVKSSYWTIFGTLAENPNPLADIAPQVEINGIFSP